MAGNWLDPKKYKHVSSDDKTTVLKHEDGHELKIAHGALSKKMQEQLKALGGAAKDAATPEQADEAKHKMADGGGVDKYGYPKSKAPRQDTPEQIEKYKGMKKGFEEGTTPSPTPTPQPQKYAEGTPDDTVEVSSAPGSNIAPQLDPEKLKAAQERLDTHNMLVKEGLAQPGSMPDQAPDAGKPQNLTLPEQSPATTPPPAQAPSQGAPQMPMAGMNGMPSPEGDLRKAYSMESQGIQQQAAAQGALGQARSGVIEKGIEAQQLAQQHFQEASQHIGNEIDGVISDIKANHISPENYWKDHSKLATGIGIILAGFNPTNSPNAAIDFLKKQMDMNLDAQKAELGKKNSMLSAYYHQFGNLKDAMEMTRLTQAGIVASKLDDAAAKAANPMAAAAAQQAKGKLLGEYAPKFQAFAMQRALMNMASQGNGNPDAAGHMIDQLSVLDPEKGKAMRARFVPGLGIAQKDIPEKIIDQINAHRDFDAAAKDLEQWTKTHTTLVPGTADYNTGVQKSMQMQTIVRSGLLNTVYREGEQPLLDKMINGNPANLMKNYNTMPQLKELRRSNEQRFNTLKGTYGFPGARSNGQGGAPQPGYVPKSFKPVGQ